MQSSPQDLFYSPFYPLTRADEIGRNDAPFADLQPFHQQEDDDDDDESTSSLYNAAAVFSNNLHFPPRPHHMSIGPGIDTRQQQHHKQKEMMGNGGHFENWGDSAIPAAAAYQTDASTDDDHKNQNQNQFNNEAAQVVVVDSTQGSMGGINIGDQKVLRRLAQNREAARKSRLRKKAYVQQLENSRLKLTQLEQELKHARHQGMFVTSGVSGDQTNLGGTNGALAFDMDYARWLDDHQRLINDVRSALNNHVPDNDLRLVVEAVMSHYDEIFRLKSLAAKSDVFHMLSGMWKSPAERCFMWIGGFRSSELLKILGNHLEPLTDQQLMGICNLQQSSQQAEDALSQGMEALQQSLVDTLSVGFTSSGNVADYMGQMAIAMGKLTTLENFLHQADLLRQQTLQQLQRILTTRQAARALLVISDYMSRLRALSSLWLARPRD
ncbi:hypothetical protein QVD17_26585 [Tagetes erecta]|uniref:Uncharacterized protein n=1 Tax=Tagetes erecta TaxID=13708 RepID=A0AAD8K9B9_TARER|nr:hypothetical protein QVD17_26585 [Tagetes erecta]